ncbi:MAG: cytidylyltransferase domain-containing protein [Candidatus Marinarcus sp.]|uniref:acylneuraminate cytidylyltransferase family protein n=1 Tax=Candidatus Marinarcus sp. TaxID=3100987 RepID=UPI003AFFD567
MYKNKTFLAIIAARGGSKRLPKKNILDVAGKPLIAWSIEAALQSNCLDEVMVTTDDDGIIKIAKEYDVQVPFKRPEALANDTALRPDVIKHTLNFYKNVLKKEFDYIVYLQPTSPLRTAEDIDNAIEYLFEKEADAIVSVCEVEHPIHWSGTLPQNKEMSQFLDKVAVLSRSQDLPKNYRLNGAIYICNTNKFLEQGCLFLKENIFAYEMPQNRSIDIDMQLDLDIASVLLEKRFSLKS